MVDPLGFSLGVLLTLLVVIVHYLRGTEKQGMSSLYHLHSIINSRFGIGPVNSLCNEFVQRW